MTPISLNQSYDLPINVKSQNVYVIKMHMINPKTHQILNIS